MNSLKPDKLSNSNKLENLEKKRVEGLITFFLQTYFGERNALNNKKLDEIHKLFMHLLQTEKSTLSEENYEKLEKIITDTDGLMNNPKTIELIQSGTITKQEFVDRYRRKLLGKERNKYDMSDLYSSGLIATDKRNGITKNEKLKLDKNRMPHIYENDDGRKFIITAQGLLMYEEWNGIDSYVDMYRIQQEIEAGTDQYWDDIVYTNILINEMSDEHYKELVLNELLDRDNIKGAKCGGYIGEIVKQKAVDKDDTIHSERQSRNGYLYRIDDDYVLKYDATDVTASMNMPIPKIQLSVTNKSNHKEDKRENMER